jgi:hypothetical protein
MSDYDSDEISYFLICSSNFSHVLIFLVFNKSNFRGTHGEIINFPFGLLFFRHLNQAQTTALLC